MNHEDNERHFQNWLDKNSWRRDIQRLEHEYGAARPSDSAEARTSGYRDTGRRPFTDEFHFDAMSVIRYLGEALKHRPFLALCPECGSKVRIRAGDRAHLCTVCEELKGEGNER